MISRNEVRPLVFRQAAGAPTGGGQGYGLRGDAAVKEGVPWSDRGWSQACPEVLPRACRRTPMCATHRNETGWPLSIAALHRGLRS